MAKKANNAVKKVSKKSAENNEWLILFLLSIFLGTLGVDRFYVGKIGTGLLKLFTGGGCGVWWIIDIILIATNKFTDAKGHVISK
ncbi:TM2 domain-containing protein [Endomicrobium proavitum]|uniref:TM2 domain-containing protein n=1 Tax=Endomicrobium proavitum TaxID=1408281 RepID=UPI00069751B0|nr:TM2 domain-containing protein [Endomicrobium proavitum]